jgi:hypothetical protein
MVSERFIFFHFLNFYKVGFGFLSVALGAEKLKIALLVLPAVERRPGDVTHCVMVVSFRLDAVELKVFVRPAMNAAPSQREREFETGIPRPGDGVLGHIKSTIPPQQTRFSSRCHGRIPEAATP